MRAARMTPLAMALGVVLGCSNHKVPDAPAPPASPAMEAVSAPGAQDSGSPGLPVNDAPVQAEAAASAAAAPSGSASVEAAAEGSTAPSARPADQVPVPDVTVANIGMHIGGGPNDAATKEPIKLSVEPHFEALRRCYAHVEVQGAGDFGVDLKIGKDGGKARVSSPRTAMKGGKFKDCVVQVFEGIEFRKPRGGATVVSYSLRFTPGPGR